MSTLEAPASNAFRVHAIPSRTLEEMRLAGRDRFGNKLTPISTTRAERRCAAACAAPRRASRST
jgi:hypothetical protein